MPPQQAVQIVDDGVEGALLVIGRPPPLNAGVRLGGHVLFQHLHQTRFANAGLAAEEHHLSHPCGGLVPAPLQECDSSSRPTSGVKPRGVATSSRVCAPLACSTR